MQDARTQLAQIDFDLDPQLAIRLRQAARARGQTPQALLFELLARGLERESQRAEADKTLQALTPREQQVAWLILRGHSNYQISTALQISAETVKTHVRHVLQKFGLHSKADLRLMLLDLGIRWWEGI
jgi:DNA-binding NarL/FixJ family response regulator